MKKLLCFSMLLILLLGSLPACAQVTPATGTSTSTTTQASASTTAAKTTQTTVPQPSGQKLIVGTMPLTVGMPVQYAFEKGYYKDEGLDVKIVVFPSGAPINEAYAARQIDVAVSGLASVFSLALGKTKWIGEINTTGGIGIYARSDSRIAKVKGKVVGFPEIYGSAELVKGMKILGPLGTVSQFNAMKYVEKFGLSSSDYQQVHMEYGAAYQAFIAGQGDAVALNPPFTFQAKAAGYICIASFEDATGVALVDGIFTSEKVATERHEDIVRFIRATYKASADLKNENVRYQASMKWFNENGKEYNENSMRSEMAVRDYIDTAFMSKPGYVYGKGMLEIANFFTLDGKIEKANLKNVPLSFDPSFINQALGIKFEVQK